MRVVLDTNVLLAGLRSPGGASFQLLRRLGKAAFTLCVSVPLILEYEAVAKRQSRELGLPFADIDDVLDYICSVAEPHAIFYLWRPLLRDPRDDLVLELAAEAHVTCIVTHNLRDFIGTAQFGIEVLSPGAFLRRVEAQS
ncbi:MAG: putative toxin-antitoxin system toxin component, PIN family [Gemmatimonadota bacterium]|nr:putative toxin-antitoxin system toxin component, PIN family [Gemmatimonadota bacterium]